MVRLPTPTSREVRWAFYVVAVCALTFVVTICWAIVHKVNQSDDIVHVAASNAAQVNRLSDQIDAQAADAARRSAQLKAQNRQVHAELTALLRYLRAHGIEIPRTAFTPPPDDGGGAGPKGRGPRGPTPPRPSTSPTPAGPAPTATPTPSPTPGPDVLCTFVPLTCP